MNLSGQHQKHVSNLLLEAGRATAFERMCYDFVSVVTTLLSFSALSYRNRLASRSDSSSVRMSPAQYVQQSGVRHANTYEHCVHAKQMREAQAKVC